MKILITFLQIFISFSLISAPEDPKHCPIILKGYDIVSYYSKSGPEKGNEKFQAVYEEKRYLFSSKKNRDAFSENPKKYVSPNGEHCAYTTIASKGKKVKANPKVYSFSNDQIFFFKNKRAKRKWELNQEVNYEKIKLIDNTQKRQLRRYENQNQHGVLLFSF